MYEQCREDFLKFDVFVFAVLAFIIHHELVVLNSNTVKSWAALVYCAEMWSRT